MLFTFAQPILKFSKLNQIKNEVLYTQCLESVTMWFTDEWGYLHDKDKTREQAIIDRKQYLANNADRVYLAFYGDLLIGAFRIEYKDYDQELISSQKRRNMQDKLRANEIWFIYVDSTYRGLTFGRQIVKEIKRISQTDMPAKVILLETLKPSLNHLYMTEGAELICENELEHHPSDVLKIKL